jgi:hypothetical protein
VWVVVGIAIAAAALFIGALLPPVAGALVGWEPWAAAAGKNAAFALGVGGVSLPLAARIAGVRARDLPAAARDAVRALAAVLLLWALTQALLFGYWRWALGGQWRLALTDGPRVWRQAAL